MRSTRFSTLVFLLLSFLNRIACAKLALTSWPYTVYTNKTYFIAWTGGDGSAVTVSLLLKDSSGSLSSLGTIWSGTGSSIYWTVGAALKFSNYYAIRVAQNGNTDYSDYFTLYVSSTSTSTSNSISASTIKGTSTSSLSTSISTRISSIETTTVTQVSTYTPESTSTSSTSSQYSSDMSSATSSSSAASSIVSTSTGALSQSSSSKSHATIAAVIVVVIFIIIALLIAIFFLRKRSSKKRNIPSVPDKTGFIPATSQPPGQANSLPPQPTTTHMAAVGPEPVPPPVPIYPNQQQQQQYPIQHFDQQYSSPQSYQQPQFQPPYPQPPPNQQYQPYQPPYQQQYPGPLPYQMQQQQQQQQYQPFPPPQQNYNQIPPLPIEGHELATMQDVKRPEMLNSHNQYPNPQHDNSTVVSPVSTHSNIHRQGTVSSAGGAEMDGGPLPRYEKVPTVPSSQPGQQPHSQQQPPSQPHGPAPGNNGPVYEMG